MAVTNDDTGTTVGSGSLIQCGLGADLTVSSGAISITDSAHFITGSGTITTIGFADSNAPTNPCFVILVRKSGATWLFAAGGNILGTIPVPTDNQPTFALWDGSTSWRLFTDSSVMNDLAVKGLAGFGPNAVTDASALVYIGADDITLYDISSATAGAVLHGLNCVPNFRINNTSVDPVHLFHTSLAVKCFNSASGSSHAATVTNVASVYAHAPTKDANTTVTNAYGVYIEAPSIGATINESLHCAGKSSMTGGVDVTDGDLRLNTARLQSFSFVITTTGGAVVQHAILGDPISGGASNYASKVTGASATAANTPQVAAGVDFTSGAGVDAGNTHEIVFNTAAQTSADTYGIAFIASNDTGTALTVMMGTTSININGVTQRRTVLYFTNATSGATYAITGANIGASKTIRVQLIAAIK